MFKPRVWVAVCIISLLYWCTWHGYQDDVTRGYYVNQTIRHTIDYSILLAITFTGWYGWKHHHQKWVLHLWILLYGAVILLTSVAGVIDYFNHIDNKSLRQLLAGLRLFFSSPVPFGILMFLAKRDFNKWGAQPKK